MKEWDIDYYWNTQKHKSEVCNMLPQKWYAACTPTYPIFEETLLQSHYVSYKTCGMLSETADLFYSTEYSNINKHHLKFC
jgi:hypothetical protein